MLYVLIMPFHYFSHILIRENPKTFIIIGLLSCKGNTQSYDLSIVILFIILLLEPLNNYRSYLISIGNI